MLMNIFSIILNVVFFIVLNTQIYTDRAKMPTGEVREWRRSPVDRLNIADQSFLFYLQIAFAVVSIISAVLLLFGVRSSIVKKVQLITTIGSAVMFIIIMIMTSNANVKYS
ncbi:MAG: hypothetical protein Q4F09_07685 [Erysipelotrichaceae bacterium]|nr:hypothetical protein [Erysipelotrichaceae bacterium]